MATSPLYKQDLESYFKSRETQKTIRRLENDKVENEHFLRQSLNPRAEQMDELLKRGVFLEAEGKLQEAGDYFQRVLAEQPDNHELRSYVNLLVKKINNRNAEAKDRERRRAWVAELGESNSEQPIKLPPPPPLPKRATGPMIPLSAAAYGRELLKQADDVRRRRAVAAKEEARLGRNELLVADAKNALAQYKAAVGGGNQFIDYKNALEEGRRAKKASRMQELQQDWDERRDVASQMHRLAGPIGGVDEIHRRQRVADPRRPAPPLSAGQRNPASSGRNTAPVSAPFARPTVEHPVLRVDPKAVRARQEVFYRKHQKQPEEERPTVPLRVRRDEELRRRVGQQALPHPTQE